MSYTGPLTVLSMKKHPQVYRAYKSWLCQRRRNAVLYTSREFINWWLINIKKRKRWVWPTVSRIDHSKGYFFKNIKLEELAENVAERNTRFWSRPVTVWKNGRLKFKARSIRAAAKFAECHPNNISAACAGRRHTLNGYQFKYNDI